MNVRDISNGMVGAAEGKRLKSIGTLLSMVGTADGELLHEVAGKSGCCLELHHLEFSRSQVVVSPALSRQSVPIEALL